MAYPAVGITKEDDNVVFCFLDDNFSQADKRKHSSAIFFLHSALGAEGHSTPQIASEKETQEGNVKCPFSTRDDMNSQRPTQFQALSDEQS